MTTSQVISLLRRKIQGVDDTAFYADLELLQALEDARSFLEAKNVTTMGTYAINVTDTNTGIAPSLTTVDSHVMTLQAAADLLSQRYSDLTLAGSLGVVWKSGLEEESTVTAEKAYRSAIQGLRKDLDSLLLIKNRTTSATRKL